MIQILCFGSEVNAAIVGALVGGLISAAVSIYGFSLLIKQNGISRQNQFETTFFNLLNYYREIYNSINGNIYKKQKSTYENKILKGAFNKADYIKQLNTVLQDEFLLDETLNLDLNSNLLNLLEFNQGQSKKYFDFYRNYSSQLNLFFGSLNNLFILVDCNLQNKKDKIKYINFLKNLLGEDELILLFFHFKFSSDKKMTKTIANFPEIFENLKTENIQYYKYY